MPRDNANVGVYRTFCDRQDWKKKRQALENKLTNGMNWFDALLQIFGVGLKLAGLEKYGKRNALDVKVKMHTVVAPYLPVNFDGFKVLQISDPHFDAIEELDIRIAQACKKAGPVDLCVLTGDYRLADYGPHKHILKSLEKVMLAVNAKHGTWAVLGNHDDHRMVDSFEKMGINCLVNEHAFIQRGDEVIQITGLDDVSKFETENARNALCENKSQFSIALVHSPDFILETAAAGYNLYLCGHTHGGQICLPNGVPIVTHSRQRRAFTFGEWRCQNMFGVTSSGSGVSGLPVRFFSQSEVNVIQLCRA